MRRRPLPAAGVGLALLAVAAAAPAQVVHVETMEAESGRAVGSVLVALVDDAGRRVAPALSGEDGRATLRAPAPGRFRVVAERVGFAPWLSPLHALADGDTLVLRAELPVLRTTLEAVRVTGRTECERDPERGAQTAALWTEVRRALQSSELTRSQRAVPLEVRRFQRQLDRRLRVQDEEMSSRRVRTDRPFVAAPEAELEASGWVRARATRPEYLGPDERVLLSDTFVGAHCFAPVVPRRGSDEARAGLVGLAFQPLPSRRVPEIEGTLWLDRATSELRHVDYRYVNLEAIARTRAEREAREVGGRIEFERLPNGAWIVSRWHIRTPRVALIQVPIAGRREPAERDSLLGYQEDGGVVTPAQLARPAVAVLAGTVVDSTRGASGTPLAGATVALAGGAYAAVTDSLGRYRIEVPDAREYTLHVRHPRLAALRLDGLAHTALLAPGETRLDLAVPGVAALRARLCGGAAAPAAAPRGGPVPGLLVGRVVAAPLGTPVGGAMVRVSWAQVGVLRPGQRVVVSTRGASVEVQADAEGYFVGCGLPADTELRLEVLGAASAGATATAGPGPDPVTIPAGALVERTLTVERGG